MNDSQPSRPVGRTAYPYFEVKLWRGRLPAPVQLRGTSIARQFDPIHQPKAPLGRFLLLSAQPISLRTPIPRIRHSLSHI